MSGSENSPADVHRAMSDQTDMAKENERLRAQIAELHRANVVQGGFRGEVPRYFLNEPCYFDDTLFPKGATVEFTGIPNLEMVPQNEAAQRVWREYAAHVELGARRVAHRNGRDFTGIVTDRNVLIDLAMMDAKAEADMTNAPALPVIKGEVPAMPHTEQALAAQKRAGGKQRSVTASTDPAPITRPNAVDQGAPMLAPRPDAEPAVNSRMVSSR